MSADREVEWRIKQARSTYAVLYWDIEGLHFDFDGLSQRAKNDKFRNELRNHANTYDPRVGALREVTAKASKFDADLWISEFVQDKKRNGKNFTVETTGLDWSEVLTEVEDGEIY